MKEYLPKLIDIYGSTSRLSEHGKRAGDAVQGQVRGVEPRQASERDDGGEAEWRARIAAREPAVGKPSLSGWIYRASGYWYQRRDR